MLNDSQQHGSKFRRPSRKFERTLAGRIPPTTPAWYGHKARKLAYQTGTEALRARPRSVGLGLYPARSRKLSTLAV